MKSLRNLLIAVIAFSASVLTGQAQTIVTGNPDFKIKITRCEASGKTVVIDMIWENVGPNDVEVNWWNTNNVAYDDEGNKYSNSQIFVKLANSNLVGYNSGVTDILPSEIPLKARIQIEGVPEFATMIRRLDIGIRCDAWHISKEKPVRITNIPITRDGD